MSNIQCLTSVYFDLAWSICPCLFPCLCFLFQKITMVPLYFWRLLGYGAIVKTHHRPSHDWPIDDMVINGLIVHIWLTGWNPVVHRLYLLVANGHMLRNLYRHYLSVLIHMTQYAIVNAYRDCLQQFATERSAFCLTAQQDFAHCSLRWWRGGGGSKRKAPFNPTPFQGFLHICFFLKELWEIMINM